jgi:STE24 endopeptidase
VLQRMFMLALTSLLVLALLGHVSGQAWFYLGLGVQPSMQAPNDALALLLLGLVLPVFTWPFTPLGAGLSRRHEFQADAYACQHTRAADLSSALLKLHEDNASTLTPDPLYARFYYSHPPALERIQALPLATA